MLIVKRYVIAISILFFLYSILMLLLPSCQHIQRNSSHAEISDESILKGRALAATYCRSCHQLPDPSLLDSKSWEKGVLPHMGPLLGIYEFNYQRYPANINDRNLKPGFYPSQPVVTSEEWKNIIDYYIATAPDSLPKQQRDVAIANNLSLFSAQTPALHYNNPAVSFVKIDTTFSTTPLIVCDLFKQVLYRFNPQLQPVDSLHSSGAIVDIHFQDKAMLTCNIGTFNPTNEKYGEARLINLKNNKMKKAETPLFFNLIRPVQLTAADLNKDGKQDYIVCEFGYLTGSLSWMENAGNDKWERHIIREVPGATKAIVQDDNNDGLEDIWALFAQGNEGIFLFTNKGNGQFAQEQVLQFPPSYGSSYFELDDFNKDGHPDIIYTCGDNADYSTVLKPYHGVYLFINDGKNHFTQKFFYPINGCYKAIARDFDNDGDLDIATIAYFADYEHQPQEGFIYFENTGNFTFKPYTLPEGKIGRWISMDAGDLDGDGKIDLVLGNFSTGPSMFNIPSGWQSGPPFLVLKNTGKMPGK